METPGNNRAAYGYSNLLDFESKHRLLNCDYSDTKSFLKSLVVEYVGSLSVQKSVLGRFPVLQLFRTYRWRDYVIKDVISGVMSGVMMIPLGLAYASLSTLPHIVGLYMSFFASLAYFVFGTSRHLSWGCVAIVSLMTANLMDIYDSSDQANEFINSLNQSDSYQTLYHSIENDGQSSKFLYDTRGSLTSDLSTKYDQEEAHYTGISPILGVDNQTDISSISAAISDRRIEVASSIAVAVGFVFVIESMIGFDCFTALLSNSLINGFMVGVAFNIATSQMNGILGLSIKRYFGNFWIFRTWVAVIEHIHNTNIAVFIISLICIVVGVIVKRFVNERYKHRMKVQIPAELFIVVVAIVVSKYIRLNDNYGVTILGPVPTGFRKPKLPDLSLVLNFDFVIYALVIAFVAHVQSLAVAKTLALQDRQRGIKVEQEMFAAGMCSIVSGLFSGFIPSAYVPISIAQRDSGGETQMASLFAAGIVLIVILLLGPYFHDLPTCVMSAIILINLLPLFAKLRTLPEEWRRSKYDCVIWIFACLATIVLEIGNALVISVVFSVFLVLLRAIVKPVIEVVPIQTHPMGALQLRPPEQYVSAKTLLTVKLMKVKTALYFFNADVFVGAVFSKTNFDNSSLRLKPPLVHKVHANTATSSTKHADTDETTPLISSTNKKASSSSPFSPSLIHWKTLVMDISEVSFLDVMGVTALGQVIDGLGSMGIRVVIASIPDNVFGILRSTGFWGKYGDRLFIDVPSALDYASSISDVDSPTDTAGLGHGKPTQIDQWV